MFGMAWTMNSAEYLFVAALNEVRKLDNPESLSVFIEELRYLYVGQSYDLYWTRNVSCPSEEDYLRMIDQTRLMTAESPRQRTKDISSLITLIGRYFQIRDDYQNLVSPDYTKQKGFCDDLDEGKFSFPLIHALENSSNKIQLLSILHERRNVGSLSFELKRVLLNHMGETKSLEYTKACLDTLHGEIDREIKAVEKEFATENSILKLLLEKLRV
ncbi:hypothetical protein G7Y79_00020g049300 [Physcia stellaris]|nr:hypothetical protein G7Y79_00020g049300 [Physcia stellaris]